MKLCIVAPQYNGLFKYSNPLYKKFADNENIEVLFVGFPEICFDIDTIKKRLELITKKIIDFCPDIIHYNYGTYDAEQLIPYFLENNNFKCKSILTYHSLQLDLFKKLNQFDLDIIANSYLDKMDGIVFFTNYAKKMYEKKFHALPKNIISWHPATHEDQILSAEQRIMCSKKFGVNPNKKNIMLLGYSSHWKEVDSILYLAQMYKDIDFYVAGPYWKEKFKKEKPDFEEINFPNLHFVNRELDAQEFLFFVESGIGFFPYIDYKSFQGSGLLPNYLFKGIPCLCNNIEPMKEYMKNSKFCFDFKNLKLLEKRFNQILLQNYFIADNSFSYQHHYKQILDFYEEII